MNREDMIPMYMNYINEGGVISPMNTESCRSYLQENLGEYISHEDVLWLFYHTK